MSDGRYLGLEVRMMMILMLSGDSHQLTTHLNKQTYQGWRPHRLTASISTDVEIGINIVTTWHDMGPPGSKDD